MIVFTDTSGVLKGVTGKRWVRSLSNPSGEESPKNSDSTTTQSMHLYSAGESGNQSNNFGKQCDNSPKQNHRLT